MPAIFHWSHCVTDDEIDEQGHVSNLEYLRWMQTAAVEHSAAQGWNAERYRTEESAWVVRSHHIEYLKPSFLNEIVEVLTWVADFRKVTSHRKFLIVRPSDSTTLARAETNWAYIGSRLGVPRRIPQTLIESFHIPTEPPGI